MFCHHGYVFVFKIDNSGRFQNLSSRSRTCFMEFTDFSDLSENSHAALDWEVTLLRCGAVPTKLQNSTTPKIHKNQNYQKLGLGLNFKKYNSSFAPASQQRIKRLNQRRKRTNTRFKHQSDLFVRERAVPVRSGRAGTLSLKINRTAA